jgi:Calx-beta domain
MSAPSSKTVRVSYATVNGTATAPSDYAAAAGTVELAPGETAKAVSVTVNGDTAVEVDERFTVILAGPSGARLADAQGVGTIVNDDATTIAQQQPPPELPPPVPGQEVNVVPKSGTVKIKLKGTRKFVELQEGEQVHVGSVIDGTKGRVTLVAASDRSGGTATADFYAGIFEVGQTKFAKPITRCSWWSS